MKFRNLILAAAAVVGLAGACEEVESDLSFPEIAMVQSEALTFDQPAASKTISFRSNRAWTATANVDWVAIDPSEGEGSEDTQTVTVTVLENTSWDRTGTVTIDIIYDTQTFPISQAGIGSPEDKILYYNDFDKTASTQTYGSSGSSWPYLDQFDGWQNETGKGIEGVTYAYSNVSVRSNSTSSGSYSDYDGSGTNNILFGSAGYLRVKGIALNGNTDLTFSFGTEKYDYNDSAALFDPAEFPVYVSVDGEKWIPLGYTYAGTTAARWNTAAATFSVPAGTEKLYFHFKSTLSGAHRLDDVRLELAEQPGDVLDFSNGITIDDGGSSSGGDDGGETGSTIYSNNFDKTTATQTYGTSSSSWPFLDQFDGWQNQTGSGASSVEYGYSNVSARANSMSNSTYSDYSGSGANNILFGTSGYFIIKKIALGGSTDLTLKFGSEKYDNNDKTALFTNTEFPVYVSNDGKKWVLISYTYAGTTAGRWNTAEGTFTVPEGTESLYIYFTASVASAYRLDDVSLTVAEKAGDVIDFSDGVDLDGGSDEGGDTPATGSKYQKVTSMIADEATYLIVAEGKAAQGISGKTYGYLSGTSVTDNDGIITLAATTEEFTIAVTRSGYTIRQSDGKYLYQTGTYNSFNLSDTLTDECYWDISYNTSDGTFVITSKAVSKYIQYSTQYSSYGSYSTQSGTLPCLYRKVSDGGDTPAPDPGNTKTVSLNASSMTWTSVSDETYGTGYSGTDGAVTVTYYKYKSTTTPAAAQTDHIRVYKDSWITVSMAGVSNITKVVFDCTAADKCFTMTDASGAAVAADTEAKTVTWTGNAMTFAAQSTGGQNRFKSVTITY